MLSDFLHAERLELIDRCKSKALRRPNAGTGSEAPLQHGVAEFLDQLIATLRMETTPANGDSDRLSGLSGAWRPIRSDLGEAAALHGRELFLRGYSVDAVVHDYGDLCQAVTELADERQVAIAVAEFHTLNRCLDNAIAEAVKEYAYGLKVVGENATLAMNERNGSFVHELRNHLSTATLAFSLVRDGRVTANGATGAIVERSLSALDDLIERGIVETRRGVTGLVRNNPYRYRDSSRIRTAPRSSRPRRAAASSRRPRSTRRSPSMWTPCCFRGRCRTSWKMRSSSRATARRSASTPMRPATASSYPSPTNAGESRRKR